MKKYLEKILEYGLYLLVFFLPWQTRWIIKAGELRGEYFEYGTISLYATDVLLAALLFIFFINKFYRKGAAICELPVAGYWLLAGLSLTICLSIFMAPDKLLAIFRLFWFLLGAGLFWLISRANFNKTKFFISFSAGIFLEAVLGSWQFLTQNSFSSKWLGLAFHEAGQLGASVVETGGERWLRAYGSLDHPNILGGVLVMGIIFIIIFLQSRSHKKYLLTSYFLLLASLSALFFTFSRAAWLALVLAFGFILFFQLVRRDWLGQKKILEIILVLGAAAFVLFSLYGDLAATRLAADSRLEKKSFSERQTSLNEVWRIIKGHWLIGAGAGNYTLVLARGKDLPAWSYQPAHNTFLLIWAEIGIFGLLFFLFLMTSLFYQSNLAGRSLLLAMFIMMFFDHWWWSLHAGVLFLFFGLGIARRFGGREKRLSLTSR